MKTVLQLSKPLSGPSQALLDTRFTIRNYTAADREAWLELRHRAFAKESLGVRRWSATDFETEFCQRWWWDPAKMWLAESKTANLAPQLVGSVTLAMRGDPNDAIPVVHWLMVAPEARRQGLGRLLMSHLEGAVWNAGYREICLETHSAWKAASRFYTSLGYHSKS